MACIAAGVSDNRVQNVVITLDKVKLCIQKSGNTTKPPLRMLSDSEATEYLWTGAHLRFPLQLLWMLRSQQQVLYQDGVSSCSALTTLQATRWRA